MKVYCIDCKYMREPTSLRVAFVGRNKSPYLCARNIKMYSTPIKECIKMEKCATKNAHNNCPDFKKISAIKRIFNCAEYY